MPGSRPLGALVDVVRGHGFAMHVPHAVAPGIIELCEALDRLTALWIALDAMGPEGQQLVVEVERVTQLIRRAVHRGHPYSSRSVVDTLADLMLAESTGRAGDAH